MTTSGNPFVGLRADLRRIRAFAKRIHRRDHIVVSHIRANDASRHDACDKLLIMVEYGPPFTVERFTFHVVGFSGDSSMTVSPRIPTAANYIAGRGRRARWCQIILEPIRNRFKSNDDHQPGSPFSNNVQTHHIRILLHLPIEPVQPALVVRLRSTRLPTGCRRSPLKSTPPSVRMSGIAFKSGNADAK